MEDMRRTLLDARPDVSWFVDPATTYSIHDNPNTLRDWSAVVARWLMYFFMVCITFSVLTLPATPARAAEFNVPYELTTTMYSMKGDGEVAVFTPEEVPLYKHLKSREACEKFFAEVDLPDTMKIMAENGEEIGKDYAVTYHCDPSGERV